MKIEELVKRLNDLKITQKSGEWLEDVSEDLYHELEQLGLKSVASELDIDKRRWYETSIEVYSILDGFLGVRSMTQLYSEQSDWSDICHTLKFYDMQEIQTISYISKPASE